MAVGVVNYLGVVWQQRSVVVIVGDGEGVWQGLWVCGGLFSHRCCGHNIFSEYPNISMPS